MRGEKGGWMWAIQMIGHELCDTYSKGSYDNRSSLIEACLTSVSLHVYARICAICPRTLTLSYFRVLSIKQRCLISCLIPTVITLPHSVPVRGMKQSLSSSVVMMEHCESPVLLHYHVTESNTLWLVQRWLQERGDPPFSDNTHIQVKVGYWVHFSWCTHSSDLHAPAKLQLLRRPETASILSNKNTHNDFQRCAKWRQYERFKMFQVEPMNTKLESSMSQLFSV